MNLTTITHDFGDGWLNETKIGHGASESVVLSASPAIPQPPDRQIYTPAVGPTILTLHPPAATLGTRYAAGMGAATVLAECDFETRSEAGYVWDAAANKFRAPKGAAKKGLPAIGAARYAEHPSTDAQLLAYDLKDGQGVRQWMPGQPNPADLFAYLARGGLIEAHNNMFERLIWRHVMERRYGWPPVPAAQWRCSMAKARAHALPGSLGMIGEVLNLPIKKDKEGERLLKLFAMPRDPTLKDPRTWIQPADAPDEFAKYAAYNRTDVLAEADASIRFPDLEGEELEFWQADQAINWRGVHIDRAGVMNCIAIIEQAHAQYNAELYTLTGGTVARASELAKLKGWLGAQGVHMDVMDDDAIGIELTRLSDAVCNGDAHPEEIKHVYRALEIRQAIGSASVKKVFAMANMVCDDDRLHDLFSYHAARTGRPTGNGPQPTNLPKAGPTVYRCGCGKHSSPPAACAWCNVPRPPGTRTVEWCVEAVEDALTVIARRDLAEVERVFHDAMLAVSGCLRGLFTAAPFHDLIASDYTAIEAVVLAALAGETWRLEVFRAKRDLYLESISRSTGIPLAELVEHKARTGMHHPLRAKGKVQELSCFTAQTQVLTDRGYVGIVDVLLTDKLWDGTEWVNHRGLVLKGKQGVMRLDGIEVTPTHKIFSNGSWREARQLASNENFLSQALATGSENLPQQAATCRVKTRLSKSDVLAGRPRTRSCSQIYGLVRLLGATYAQRKNRVRNVSFSTNTRALFRMMNTAAGCSIAWPLAAIGATTQKTPHTPITGAGGYSFMSRGGQTNLSSCATSSRCPGGTTPCSTLTASKSTKGTSPAICDSLPAGKTATTSEPLEKCSSEYLPLKNVYDIAHAGPRNRFTIRTNSGHLIVHNCGYGGWLGALRAFGAEGTDEELKAQIIAWREASPAVVEFWGGQSRNFGRTPGMFGLEGAAITAVLHPGQRQHVPRLDGTLSGISYVMHGDALYCQLPSGRYLTYHRPRLEQTGTWRGYSLSFEGYNTNPKAGAMGWVRMQTYSGKLCENVVQAVARDIQRHAIVNLEREGYPVVLHVYDEDVSEIPQGWGSIAEFESIMNRMPAWAAGWPISASGGWVGRRYRKA